MAELDFDDEPRRPRRRQPRDSAFAAGFRGTFGVLAALFVIGMCVLGFFILRDGVLKPALSEPTPRTR